MEIEDLIGFLITNYTFVRKSSNLIYKQTTVSLLLVMMHGGFSRLINPWLSEAV
jgi:hypothetical protein